MPPHCAFLRDPVGTGLDMASSTYMVHTRLNDVGPAKRRHCCLKPAEDMRRQTFVHKDCPALWAHGLRPHRWQCKRLKDQQSAQQEGFGLLVLPEAKVREVEMQHRPLESSRVRRGSRDHAVPPAAFDVAV